MFQLMLYYKSLKVLYTEICFKITDMLRIKAAASSPKPSTLTYTCIT